MLTTTSKLFGQAGYIPLIDYVEDIRHTQKHGPWKLPLGLGDNFHLLLLSFFCKVSWFSDILYIKHPHQWSPSYAILLTYLQKNDILDSIFEKNLHHLGHHFFYAEKKILVEGKEWTVGAQGLAKDPATALSKTIGEMTERMIAGVQDKNKNIIIATPRKIIAQHNAYYPPTFHRYLDIQREKYPRVRHNWDQEITWVIGKSLVSGEKTYIPKDITSWFRKYYEGSLVLINSTTNGSAGYFTKTGAILRGLLEVVQRDAFLVHWLTQIAPPLIRNDTLPVELQAFVSHFENQGLSVYILDTTVLCIPSVSVVAISEKAEIPQVVIAASSACTLSDAIHNALQELVAGTEMFYWETENATQDAKSDVEPFISGINKITRQTYWRGEEKVNLFRWFISGYKITFTEAEKSNVVCGKSDEEALDACIKILRKFGKDYEPIVYLPQNRIQEKIGFYVAQVFIPKAFPFYLLERYGTFESDRLSEFALSKNKPNWQLNTLPHMFS